MLNRSQLSNHVVDYSGFAETTQVMHTLVTKEIASLRDATAPDQPTNLFLGATGNIELSIDGSNIVSIEPVSSTSNASTSFFIHNNRPVEILPDDANKTVKISDLVIRRVPDASYITSTYNLELGRNLKVRGSGIVEGDMLINGGFLSESLAVLRNFNGNEQIGYQFRINDDNLLELVKYENNKTKRMMLFGKGDVFGSNDIESFPTITEEGISSNVGSVFKLNSGGAWVFIEGVDKMYADLQQVGIGTSNPNPLATLEVVGSVITSGTLFVNSVSQIVDSQDWSTKISTGTFPPLPMTSNVSVFEDTFYGLGTYNATASSSNAGDDPFKAFDQVAGTVWSSTSTYTDETARAFPPANMTAATTTYTTGTYGLGSYTATSSTVFNGAGWEPWRAFAGGLWHSVTGQYSSGVYTANTNSTAGYPGDWLQLQMPYAAAVQTFTVTPRAGYTSRTPREFRLYGSMDGSTWSIIYDNTTTVFTNTNPMTFTVPQATAGQYYSYLRFAVKSLTGNTSDADTVQMGLAITAFHRYAPYANLAYYPLANKVTTVGATSYRGEWLQVQLPQPLKLTSYTIRSGSNANRTPRAWHIMGSSDGTTWSLLDTETTQTLNASTDYTYSAASALYYTYFRMVVTEIRNTANDYVSLASLALTGNYFGSENPTFTLPPSAMTAATQSYTNFDVSSGSYTASASSTSGTDDAWKAFDGITNTATYWTAASARYDATGAYVGAQSTVASNGTTYAGEWIQLSMPQEAILSGYRMAVPTGMTDRGFQSLVVLGSMNGGNTWDLVDQRVDVSWEAALSQLFTFSPKATAYSVYRFVILQKKASAADTNVSLAVVALRGTVPSIKMPPAPMTANTTAISGFGGADGQYVASASSEVNANEAAYRVADGDSLNPMWTANPQSLYNGTTGAYVGTTSTVATNGTTYLGEWVQLRFPRPVLMKKYVLGTWSSSPARAPENFAILGSNSGSTWTLVDQRVGVVWDANTLTNTFILATPPTVYYTHYRLVALKKIAGADNWMSLSLFNIYGPLDYVNLFIENYNIGINTANPQSLLDVRGSTKVGGHIMPRSNLVYDLGASNMKFRDLYLSGNTIDMEDTIISVSSNNQDIEIRSRSSGALRSVRVDEIKVGETVIGKGTGTTLAVGDSTSGGQTTSSSISAITSLGSNVGIQKATPGAGLPTPLTSISMAPSIRPIISSIAVGYDHTLLLMSDGSVRAFGNNAYGQLGDGTTTTRLTWVNPVDMTSGVKSVYAGIHSSYAVMQNGSLRAWGRNSESQMGDGTTTNRSTWVQPQNMGRNVVRLASVMGYHWAAIMADGSLWTCGYNNNGQIGDGTTTNRSLPFRLLEGGFQDAGCGEEHTLVLMNDGTIRGWGRNEIGQLGNGTTTRALAATQTLNITTASSFSVGGHHCFVKLADGTWRAFGYNAHGQLGDGTTTTRSTPVTINFGKIASWVSCGTHHTLVQYLDGTVGSIGYNNEGQVGNNATATSTTTWQVPVSLANTTTIEIAAGKYNSFIRLIDNSLVAFGFGNSGQLGNGLTGNFITPNIVIPALPRLQASALFTRAQRAISGGMTHSMVVTSTGRLLVAGNNRYGQLGDNTTTQRQAWVTPQGFMSGVLAVACGFYHSVVLMTDGSVRTFGMNTYGQLGDGTTTQRNTFVTPTGLSTGCVAIAANGYHTAVVMADGSVRTFGWNINGQLGDGTTTNRATPITPTGLTTGVIAVACGEFHTVALMADGTLRAFGSNAFGQLGDGTTTQRLTAVTCVGFPSQVVSISAGSQHTAALLSDGTLRSCGLNMGGQLGNPSTTIPSSTSWIAPLEMGTTLTIREIACGNMNTHMLMSDNTMRIIGFGGSGSLASTSLNEQGGTNVTVLGVGDWWQVNDNVNLATGIPIIKTNRNVFQATAPLLVTFRWVSNADIALLRVSNSASGPIIFDHSAPNPVITTVMIQPGQYFAFRSGGSIQYNWIFQWNANNNGMWQAPRNITGNVQTFGCGMVHTIAMMTNETLRGWGNNTYGQLANNSTSTYLTSWVSPVIFNESVQRVGSWLDVTGNVNFTTALSPVQVYPPSAMSTDTLTLASTSNYAGGNYFASASSFWAESPIYYPWRAFDKSISSYWQTGTSIVYNQATGNYIGNKTTNIRNIATNATTTYSGEWLQLQLPTPIQVVTYNLGASLMNQWKYLGEVDLGGSTGPYQISWSQVEQAMGPLANKQFKLVTILRNSSTQAQASYITFDQNTWNGSTFTNLSYTTNVNFINVLTVQNTNGLYSLVSEQRYGNAKTAPYVDSTGAYAYSPWGDLNIYKVTFYGILDPPTSNQAPNSWILAGSRNGNTWDLLDTRSNITFSGTTAQTFACVPNTMRYNYVRLICLSKLPESVDPNIAIGSFDIFGQEPLLQASASNATLNLNGAPLQLPYSNVIFNSNNSVAIRNASPSNLFEVGSNLMSVSLPEKRVSFGAGTRLYRQKATMAWAAKVDGAGDDYYRDVVCDSQGDVIAVGQYNSALTIYHADNTTAGTLTAAGDYDGVIVKYNSAGRAQWWARISAGSYEETPSVAVDSQDNIYVCGVGNGNFGFWSANNTMPFTLTSAGSWCGYVAKLNPQGIFQWVARIDGTGQEVVNGVAVDAAGNVYVGGHSSSGTLTFFNSGGATARSFTQSGWSWFICKYDTNGTNLWATRIDAGGEDVGQYIACSQSGEVYAFGRFTSAPVAFYNANGTIATVQAPPLGGHCGCVAKFSTNGMFEWACRLDGTSTDECLGGCVDNDGNPIAVGYYNTGPLRILNANGTTATTLPQVSSNAGFMVKITSNGTFAWGTRIDSPGSDVSWRVKVDGTNNPYLSGYNQNTATTFFNSDNVAVYTMPAPTGHASWVAKYDPNGYFMWAAYQDSTDTDEGRAVAIDKDGGVYVAGYLRAGSGRVFNSDNSVAATMTFANGANGAMLVKYSQSGLANGMFSIQGGATTPIGLTLNNSNQLAINRVDAHYAADVVGTIRSTAINSNALVTANNNLDLVGSSMISSTVINYLSGLRSNIQQQLDLDMNTFDSNISGPLTVTGRLVVTGQRNHSNIVEFDVGNQMISLGVNSNNHPGEWFTDAPRHWAARIDGPGAQDVLGVDMDKLGNVFVCGTSAVGGTSIFNKTGVAQSSFATLGNAAFIVKYNKDGFVLWSVRIDGSEYDNARCIGCDHENNVIVCGVRYSSTVFYNADGSVAFTMSGTGTWVAKYNGKTGFLIWCKRIDRTNNNEGGLALAVSRQTGAIAIAVHADQTPIVLYDKNSNTLTNTTTINAFTSWGIGLALIDNNGNIQWTSHIDGTGGNNNVLNMHLDKNGSVYITGSYQNTVVNFYAPNNSSTVSNSFSGSASGGMFLVKYTGATGNFEWAIQSSSTITLRAVDSDSAGNIYVATSFSGTNAQLKHSSSGYNTAIYTFSSLIGTTGVLLKLSANGEMVLWNARVDGTIDEHILSVSVDGMDYPTICGSYTNAVLYDSTSPLSSQPGLIVKYYNMGYFNGDANWFSTRLPTGTSITNLFNNLTSAAGGLYVGGDSFSFEWFGYFCPTTTGAWSFGLSSDDYSQMWLGPEALSGYSGANRKTDGFFDGGFRVFTMTLNAGEFYPVRIQYGDNWGGENIVMGFKGPTDSSYRYDLNGYFFTGPASQSITVLQSSSGGTSGYAIQFDKNGVLRWTSRMDGTLNDSSVAISMGKYTNTNNHMVAIGTYNSAPVRFYDQFNSQYAMLDNIGSSGAFITYYVPQSAYVINANPAPSNPEPGYQAGFEVGRGILPMYKFVYDENTRLFKMGQENLLQTATTRQELSNVRTWMEGGTVTTVNGYRIHAFTTTGASTLTVRKGGLCEVLIVGGGGAGGGTAGGGGGAGGIVYLSNYMLPEGTINITVGAGGIGNSASGQNSVFNGIVALGGGGGASMDGDAIAGGSGGGGNRINGSSSLSIAGRPGALATQPTSVYGGFGNAGGEGKNTSGANAAGGGGGGAGGFGQSAFVAGRGGNGGVGFQTDISGTFTYYGGGGGGGSGSDFTIAGTGGLGGGGNGATGSTAGSAGLANTGAGGGGGGAVPGGGGAGGNGGSGIVIVRYVFTNNHRAIQAWDSSSNTMAFVNNVVVDQGSNLVLGRLRDNATISVWDDIGRHKLTSNGAVYPTNNVAFPTVSGSLAMINGYLNLPQGQAVDQNWWTSGFDFTVETWINIANRTNDSYFIQHGNGVGNIDWGFGVQATGQARVYTWNGSSALTAVGTTVLSLNQWHHVAFTWQHTTQTIRLFVNGTLEASVYRVATVPTTFAATTLTLGHNATFTYYINGLHVCRGLLYLDNFAPNLCLPVHTSESLFLLKAGDPVVNGRINVIGNMVVDSEIQCIQSPSLITNPYASRPNPLNSFGAPVMILDSGTPTNTFINAAINHPVYVSNGAFWRFTRAASQYVDFGTKTFSIAETGFSAVVVVRVTDNAVNYERIFEFANANTNFALNFSRETTTNNVYVGVSPGQTYPTNWLETKVSNALITDLIRVYGITISNTGVVRVYVNGQLAASGQTATVPTSRTVSNTWVGRSVFTPSTYSSMDVFHLSAYNASMTAVDMEDIYKYFVLQVGQNLGQNQSVYEKYGFSLGSLHRPWRNAYFNDGVQMSSIELIQDQEREQWRVQSTSNNEIFALNAQSVLINSESMPIATVAMSNVVKTFVMSNNIPLYQPLPNLYQNGVPTSNLKLSSNVQTIQGLEYRVSASSSNNVTNSPFNAFDGDIATEWICAPNYLNPCWIEYVYPTPVILQGYNIVGSTIEGTRCPSTWAIQGSMDGVYYHNIDIRSNESLTIYSKSSTYIFSAGAGGAAGLGGGGAGGILATKIGSGSLWPSRTATAGGSGNRGSGGQGGSGFGAGGGGGGRNEYPQWNFSELYGGVGANGFVFVLGYNDEVFATGNQSYTTTTRSPLRILLMGGGGGGGPDPYYNRGGGGAGYLTYVEVADVPAGTVLSIGVGGGGNRYTNGGASSITLLGTTYVANGGQHGALNGGSGGGSSQGGYPGGNGGSAGSGSLGMGTTAFATAVNSSLGFPLPLDRIRYHFSVNTLAMYRYYRMFITQNSGNPTITSVADLNLLTSSNPMSGFIGIGVPLPTVQLDISGTGAIAALEYVNLPVTSTSNQGILQLTDLVDLPSSDIAASSMSLFTLNQMDLATSNVIFDMYSNANASNDGTVQLVSTVYLDRWAAELVTPTTPANYFVAPASNATTFPAFSSVSKTITFNRAALQYLNMGPITMNLPTEGLTLVARARFDGTVGSFERIFDFSAGDGIGTNMIILSRNASSGSIWFEIRGPNDNSVQGYTITTPATTITQETWLTLAARYDPYTSGGTMTVWINGVLAGTLTNTSSKATARTMPNSYIGRSTYTNDAYFNGAIAYAGVFKSVLSDNEIWEKHAELAEITNTNTLVGSALNVNRIFRELESNSNAVFSNLSSNANFSYKGVVRLESNINVPDYPVNNLQLLAPLFSSNSQGWNDQGPLRLTPVITGAPTRVAGPSVYGNALYLNNTVMTAGTQLMQYNGLSVSQNGPFTCTAWLQVQDATAFQTVLCLGSATSENGFKLQVQPNQISFLLTTQNATGGATWDVDLRGSMTVGTWFHAAVTFEGSLRRARLYINGDLVATGTTVNSSLPLGNNTTLRLGNAIGLNQASKVAVADLRLYNRLLSEQELRDIVLPQFTAATASAAKTAYDFAASLSNYGRDFLYIAQNASTSNAGIVSLSTSVTSTASNLATTPSTIQFINDMAEIAYEVVAEQTTPLLFPPVTLTINSSNEVTTAPYANGMYAVDASTTMALTSIDIAPESFDLLENASDIQLVDGFTYDSWVFTTTGGLAMITYSGSGFVGTENGVISATVQLYDAVTDLPVGDAKTTSVYCLGLHARLPALEFAVPSLPAGNYHVRITFSETMSCDSNDFHDLRVVVYKNATAPTYHELANNSSVIFEGAYTYNSPTFTTAKAGTAIVSYNGTGYTTSIDGLMSATVALVNAATNAVVANSTKTVSVYNFGFHAAFPQLRYAVTNLPIGTYRVSVAFSANMSSDSNDFHSIAVASFPNEITSSGLVYNTAPVAATLLEAPITFTDGDTHDTNATFTTLSDTTVVVNYSGSGFATSTDGAITATVSLVNDATQSVVPNSTQTVTMYNFGLYGTLGALQYAVASVPAGTYKARIVFSANMSSDANSAHYLSVVAMKNTTTSLSANVTSQLSQWMSQSNFVTGTSNVSASNATLTGEWLQLTIPEQIVPTGYKFDAPNNSNNYPKEWLFLASSNSGSTWDVLDQRTVATAAEAGATAEYTISTSNLYNTFRMHVDSAIGQGFGVQLINWSVLGARTTLRADPDTTMLATVNLWQQDASNNPRFFFTSNAGTLYTSATYEHVWRGSNGAFLAGIASNGDLSASNVIAFSDARLKTDVVPITGALDTALQLRGVAFERHDDDRQHIGFIAQEVQPLVPEVVRQASDGTLSIAYDKMVALLIESIKDLDDMLEAKLANRRN